MGNNVYSNAKTVGQHKAMLIVQNDGIIAHIDAPIVLHPLEDLYFTGGAAMVLSTYCYSVEGHYELQ